MSGIYNAGTVWKQENGKWMAIFHTNIKHRCRLVALSRLAAF